MFAVHLSYCEMHRISSLMQQLDQYACQLLSTQCHKPTTFPTFTNAGSLVTYIRVTYLCLSWLKQSLSMVIIVVLSEININFCGYSVVFCSKTVELRVPGLFVPKTFRSQERIVPMGNFCSRDFSFPGTFVPWERKFPGTFVPGPFRSPELSFPGNESS